MDKRMRSEWAFHVCTRRSAADKWFRRFGTIISRLRFIFWPPCERFARNAPIAGNNIVIISVASIANHLAPIHHHVSNSGAIEREHNRRQKLLRRHAGNRNIVQIHGEKVCPPAWLEPVALPASDLKMWKRIG